MREHAYGNTASGDLWREVERAAAKPVTAIAHDFTLQPGVPLIRVGEPACKGGSMRVALAQGEFSRDQPARKALTWRVPVIAQGAGGKEQARTLVAGGKGSLTLPGCGPVVVNAGQSGYYRTLYSQAGFAQLTSQFGALAPIDQLGMLADTWSLGMAGLQPASNILDLAEATPAGADPQVWALLARSFGSLHAMYGEDKLARARLDTYAVRRLAPVMAQIGWNAQAGEPTSHANLRAQLIGTLSRLGDQATIDEARRRYAAMGTDPSAVPGALRKTIMAVVAEHADAAGWEAMRRAAQAEKSPMIKDAMYGLLASSDDRLLAERALALALSDEPGATNGAAMIATVSRSHPELAFDFALANIKAVNERVDATSRSRYVPGLAANASTPAMIEKVRAYAEAHIAPEARRDAETAIAGIKDRIKVRSERLPEIDAWLAQHLKQAGKAA
jgi:aminopeptidase N